MTHYVIPEACANIAYSIVSEKRDAFRDASSICKTRVTSVTVMDTPYPQKCYLLTLQFSTGPSKLFEFQDLTVATVRRWVSLSLGELCVLTYVDVC